MKIKYGSLYEITPSCLCNLPSNEEGHNFGQGLFEEIFIQRDHAVVKEYFTADREMAQHEASLMFKLSLLYFGCKLIMSIMVIRRGKPHGK